MFEPNENNYFTAVQSVDGTVHPTEFDQHEATQSWENVGKRHAEGLEVVSVMWLLLLKECGHVQCGIETLQIFTPNKVRVVWFKIDDDLGEWFQEQGCRSPEPGTWCDETSTDPRMTGTWPPIEGWAKIPDEFRAGHKKKGGADD